MVLGHDNDIGFAAGSAAEGALRFPLDPVLLELAQFAALALDAGPGIRIDCQQARLLLFHGRDFGHADGQPVRDPLRFGKAGLPFILLPERARRPGVPVLVPVPIILAHMLVPAGIRPPVGPALMLVDRVIPGEPDGAVVPRIDADPGIAVVVIIAEAIMVVPGIGKQVQQHQPQVQDDVGGVHVAARADIIGRREIDRREENTPLLERVIPVAGHEHMPARRPDIMGRLPAPVRGGVQPIALPQHILAGIPVPAGRHPDAVFGTGARRFRILKDGRRRQVFDFPHPGRGPESGYPLPLVAILDPIAGHPVHSGRGGAPAGADPDIAAVRVPGPVAGNPDGVPLGRLLGGRGLVHGFGRRRRRGHRLLDLKVHGLRKRFVNGTPGQNLRQLLVGKGRRQRMVLRRQTTRKSHRDRQPCRDSSSKAYSMDRHHDLPVNG